VNDNSTCRVACSNPLYVNLSGNCTDKCSANTVNNKGICSAACDSGLFNDSGICKT
jgi:hypothetical protein